MIIKKLLVKKVLSKSLYFLIFVFLLLFSTAPLLAQTPAQEPIDISARKIIYSDNRQDILATGNVHITYKYDTLRADTAYVNLNTKIIRLEGNAIIQGHDGKTLSSSKLIYSMKTQRGFAYHTSGYYNPWYYTATKGRQYGDTEVYIEQGTVSTCSSKPPHYYFLASKMKIFPKDKIVAENVFMIIDDMPILYLPFTIFSLRQKSAFWQFNAGYSRYKGFTLENSFRLLDKTNYKLMYNYNYYSLLGNESRLTGALNLKKFYIDSRISWLTNSDTFDELTGKPKTLKNDFFTKLNTRWTPNKIFNMNSSVNYSSSLNYLSGTYRDTSVTEIKNSEITSFLNANFRYKRLYSNIFIAKKYFWDIKKSAYAPYNFTFPRATLNLTGINLLKKPRLLLTLSNSYMRNQIYYPTLRLTNTLTSSIALNNNLRLWRPVSLNSAIQYTFAYSDNPFSRRHSGKFTENLTLSLWRLRNQTSYSIASNFSDSPYITSHSITNNLNFRLAKNISFLHTFSYDLINDTFGLEIASLRIDNKYIAMNMRLTKSFCDYMRLPTNFKNFNASLKIELPYHLGTTATSMSITRIGAAYNAGLTLSANLKPTKNWRITYSTSLASRDINVNPLEQTSQTISISRDLHCWVMEIYYHSFKGIYGVYDEWWLRVRLKNLNLFDVKLLSEQGY